MNKLDKKIGKIIDKADRAYDYCHKVSISQIKQSILKAIEEEINKMEKDPHDRRTYLSVIKEVLK